MEGVEGVDVSADQMHIDLTFKPEEYRSIKNAAQQCSVTPATFFYAAWALCLGLYTDSENVVVGAVLSTRNLGLSGSFETIGPMVNTLPLQVDLCWEVSVRDFVKDVFDRMRRLMHYSWTTPDNGFTRIKCNLMAMTPNEQQWAEGSGVRSSFFKHTTNLPLNAIVKDDGSGMILQYSSRRFSRNAMETLAGVFKVALTSLCETEAPLESARVLPSSYLESLSSMGNWQSQKTTVSSITEDLVTLFERTTERYPSAVAIDSGSRQVTYAELESLSGKVAHALSGQIERQEVVAVHADGSINWIISIYGILRAGGIYCPLDKAHPQHYRDSLFESSTAKIFLATNTESMSKRCSTAEVALDIQAILDGHVSGSSSHACFTARAQPRPQDRAYLCFTSGSTGKPKGVMCTHQGLVAFQSDLEVRLGASVGTRIAQIMSVAFDGAIHELFSALSYGSTLVLRKEGEEAGLSHLKTVDCAILTPSLASVLDPGDFPRLKTVYLVGEIVPQTVCDTWSARKAVYNMYGPTEATCGATIKRLRPGEPVTIGGPNPSTRIYILDHHRRLVPPGRTGEIYLAGVQVARGYIGRPEVTKERFLEDPFHGSGEFMYKTGDRGYWSEDGEIIFLGRADRQIKLHGFRVDLEDLEARILRACNTQYGVRAVAMTNRMDDLVCMIQTESTDLVGIKDTIRRVLPAFAVPKCVSVAHSLPMTPNMKVDYRAIAHVADSSVMTESAQRAVKDEDLRTETEIAVAAVWSKVLELAATAVKIGPESNFIQLGGHSLQQLKLTSSLRAVFGTHITMRMLLTLPTLRDLAAAIDQMDKGLLPAPSLPPSLSPGREYIDGLQHSEPGPMEKEWWQKGQLNRGTSAFNVSWVAQYDGNIFNQSRMIVAWNMVLASYDIFRARYVCDHEHGLQRVLAKFPPRIEQRRRIDVRKELNRPFNLAEEAPVRVIMTGNTVVAVLSHIVCDYTTLGLVLHEAATAYQCCPSLLMPLRPQPCHQRVVSNTVDPACLDFWSEYLGDVKHNRHAYLGNGGERRSYDGRSLTGLVSTSLWHRMQNCVQQSGVTLQQLLVAAVAMALSAEDEEIDLTLGMPFINRHSETEMKAVGLFLEPLPVRVRFGDLNASLKSFLASAQASSQRALAHVIPWDQLLKHLNVDVGAHLPNHPLFDCVASFHDARGQDAGRHNQERGGPWSKAAWGGGVEPQLVWSDGAKFKLMVECLAYDEDTLVLRLEYDTACFGQDVVGSEGRIEAVRRMILTAMDAVVSHQDGVFDKLWRDLREAWRLERSLGFNTGHDVDVKLLDGGEDLFLKCFSQLKESEA
ncbi:nonribosomal peptide synthase [Colletotrichum karsti]|uniref:Nonribosomal peptide synthase n=1 Tax=Colletotrichum karsti TaxID=1095194 RepID=A0A9P6IG09_9PEZI|nr:nonribosomal peptide synthase [Colletotrichum karsti]KAF9881767.1 nonribosomal peptide synthase [Colletotrichum karsti]